jgi:predicted ArsR family transcriptional regulator
LGLRLLFLSWWTPKYIIYKELARVDALTTNALEALLTKTSTNIKEEKTNGATSKVSIEERRDAMALKHANLVNSLVEVLGKEEAIRLGREAMFKIGEEIGRETCQKLGVGKSLKDLTKAAKILYRILGIEFEVRLQDSNTAILIVNRCAFAANYSELTCQILSATDEGTIKGLNQNMKMAFTQKMTSGHIECKAKIKFEINGGPNN